MSSEVGAQAFDVEPGENTPRRGEVEPARVWRSERKDPEGTHPPWGEQRGRRELLVLRVQQHLVPHSELVPVLMLLLPRQHFRSHAPHQVRGSFAGPRWVGCSRGGQGAAAGVPAAVGVEGRVAGAERRGPRG